MRTYVCEYRIGGLKDSVEVEASEDARKSEIQKLAVELIYEETHVKIPPGTVHVRR
jgi:hypothetical protein